MSKNHDSTAPIADPTHGGFPVLTAWLAATAEDFKKLPGVRIEQYGLYFTHGRTGFAALKPDDPDALRVGQIMESAQQYIGHERFVELVCVHLDNGDEFSIRPQEAYEYTLDSAWRDWVESSRGVYTPEIEAAMVDA